MVGALAVVYASIGDGAWARRSAIAWMMGSWGARLAVQGFYTRAVQRANAAHRTAAGPKAPRDVDADAGSHALRQAHGTPRPSRREGLRCVVLLVIAAVVCSVPGMLAAFNREPELSRLELAACALWLVGFAGETTADRQRLRFIAKAEHEGLPCRGGLWRFSRHADRVFTGMVWIAFAIFGGSAMYGWRP